MSSIEDISGKVKKLSLGYFMILFSCSSSPELSSEHVTQRDGHDDLPARVYSNQKSEVFSNLP